MEEIDQRVRSLEESVEGNRSEMTTVKSDLESMKTSISRILELLEPRESTGNVVQTSSSGVLPPVGKPPEDAVIKSLQPSEEVNKHKEGASGTSGSEVASGFENPEEPDKRRLQTQENGNPSFNDLENGNSTIDPLVIVNEDKGTDSVSNENSRNERGETPFKRSKTPLIDSNKENGTDPGNEEGKEDSTNNIQDEPPKKRFMQTLTIKNVLGTSTLYNTKNNEPSIKFRMDVEENLLKPVKINFNRIEKATTIYKTGLEEFKENVPKVASMLEKTVTFFNSLPNEEE